MFRRLVCPKHPAARSRRLRSGRWKRLLDAKTLPVVLRKRRELVEAHVWLDAGTPIRAHHVSAGKVQFDRFREWTAGSEPSFSQTMPCSALALAGNVELTPAEGNCIWSSTDGARRFQLDANSFLIKRMSTSQSTNFHSSVVRSSCTSSSKSCACSAEYSNQVRKSNGSPSSRP